MPRKKVTASPALPSPADFDNGFAPLGDAQLSFPESSSSPPPAQLPLISTRRERELFDASHEILLKPEVDDWAYLHATFAQVGLPRSRVEGRTYESRCGNASIKIEAGELYDGKRWVPQMLPYGTKPRIMNIYMTTYAVQNKTPVVPLGDSRREAMRILGFKHASGGKNGSMTSFDQQLRAFSAMRLMLGVPSGKSVKTINAKPIREFDAWVVPDGAQRALWPRALQLDMEYFESLREFAYPLDPRALAVLDSSSLALDVYAFLAHRLWRVNNKVFLPWPAVRQQFGASAQDPKTFKTNMQTALRQVLKVYPKAKVDVINGGLLLKNSPPPVPRPPMVSVIEQIGPALPG